MLISTVMMFIGATAILWAAIVVMYRSARVYKSVYTSDMTDRFEDMFVFVNSDRLFAIHMVSLLLLPVLVYFTTHNVIYTLGSIGLVFLTPKLVYVYLHKKRQAALVSQLPDALIQVSGSMRAGASIVIALEAMVKETSGPIAQEFSLVLREMRLGVTMDDAFENLAQRVKEEDYTLVVSAARIAREVGGNLAETFERLADTLRKKIAMEGKIVALTSQGKLQGWVVGLLPFGMMLVLFQMEPAAMYPLLHSIVGWAVLGVVLVMELLGAFMISKIVNIDI